MPTVRLSGSIGETDPTSKREARALLLYLLFRDGWDIYNSNGDQRITLSNIEGKIIESDAFAFMPGPLLEDLFKLTSIFVGYQTLDKNLRGKPTVILNGDGSWRSYFELLSHLQKLGTIRQDVGEFLHVVNDAESLSEALTSWLGKELPDAGRKAVFAEESDSYGCAPSDGLRYKVCVFCSATVKKAEYLRDGYAFGKLLAEAQIGCVSGAGKTGVMGQVVAGASENGGWTGGSNVPHIIALEGLPEGRSCFWPRPDIYTRMEVMIENSDAFVAFPGGSGTVQEVLALLVLQQQGDPLMLGKPIVLFNRTDESGVPFWEPLIKLLDEQGAGDLVHPVTRLQDLLPAIDSLRERALAAV